MLSIATLAAGLVGNDLSSRQRLFEHTNAAYHGSTLATYMGDAANWECNHVLMSSPPSIHDGILASTTWIQPSSTWSCAVDDMLSDVFEPVVIDEDSKLGASAHRSRAQQLP